MHSSMQYSTFDHVVSLVQRAGKNAICGKHDIKPAFRLFPIYPRCFDLLGFKLNGKYYIDKMLQMGCSQSCSYFETCSSFIEWTVKSEADSDNVDHYLDDFFFVGESNTKQYQNLMDILVNVCERMGVPLAHEKTEGPKTIIEYLGLTIDTEQMLIKIPIDKIVELFVLNKKKVTLKELQSLAGSLALCTRAFTAGRTFIRQICTCMGKVRKSFHFIKVINALKYDLLVWIQFLDNFNDITYIHDNWITNIDL